MVDSVLRLPFELIQSPPKRWCDSMVTRCKHEMQIRLKKGGLMNATDTNQKRLKWREPEVKVEFHWNDRKKAEEKCKHFWITNYRKCACHLTRHNQTTLIWLILKDQKGEEAFVEKRPNESEWFWSNLLLIMSSDASRILSTRDSDDDCYCYEEEEESQWWIQAKRRYFSWRVRRSGNEWCEQVNGSGLTINCVLITSH
jgi:hypothetical protein